MEFLRIDQTYLTDDSVLLQIKCMSYKTYFTYIHDKNLFHIQLVYE